MSSKDTNEDPKLSLIDIIPLYPIDAIYNFHDSKCKKRRLAAQLGVTLAYYSLNNTIIGRLTQSDHRTVQRYVNICKNTHEEEFKRRKERSRKRLTFPNEILKNKVTEYYSILLLAYIRYHSEDPYEKIDLDAFVKAWIFFKTHLKNIHVNQYQVKDVEINYFYFLCHSMTCLNYSLSLESDYVCLKYSKTYNFYFSYSIKAKPAPEALGYQKIKTLAEIDREIKKAKEKEQTQSLTQAQETSVSPVVNTSIN